MGHHHHHHHGHFHGNADKKSSQIKALTSAFFLNFFFTILEIIVGFYSNSLAILSDSIHDLGDSIALLFAIVLEKISHKKPTELYTYGFKRFSPLAAFINTAILILGSIFIIMQTIPRIIEPELVKGSVMFYFSILGIIINGSAFFKIKNSDGNLNSRTMMLHLLEDMLGWIAVFIGSIFIYFFEWYFIDAYLSLGIAAYIGFNATKNLKEIFIIFMQRAPFSTAILKDKIQSLKGILSIDDIKFWLIEDESYVINIKLTSSLTSLHECEELKHALTHALEEYPISDLSIDISSHAHEEHSHTKNDHKHEHEEHSHTKNEHKHDHKHEH